MQALVQIRPAQPADAEVASVLLYSAYMHTQITFPQQEEHELGLVERLAHFFRQDGNRFSYQNSLVADHNSAVVGLVLSFGGRDEARLNAAVASWLEREAQDDEWYVDALAVFGNWGRKGIGAGLLQCAEQQARQYHYTKIALHVAEGNNLALDLYSQLHYVVTQQTLLYQRPHVRMVKTLENRQQGDGSAERVSIF